MPAPVLRSLFGIVVFGAAVACGDGASDGLGPVCEAAPPTLEVDCGTEPSLNFGGVSPSRSETRSLVCTNLGGEAVTVTAQLTEQTSATSRSRAPVRCASRPGSGWPWPR